MYAKSKNIKPVLNGLGISIISTSKGLMTDKQAKEARSAVKFFVTYGKTGYNMSRIGKSRFFQDKVQSLDGDIINVKGPKGSLARKLHPAVVFEIDNQVLNVSTDTSDKKESGAAGLYRSLIYNGVWRHRRL